MPVPKNPLELDMKLATITWWSQSQGIRHSPNWTKREDICPSKGKRKSSMNGVLYWDTKMKSSKGSSKKNLLSRETYSKHSSWILMSRSGDVRWKYWQTRSGRDLKKPTCCERRPSETKCVTRQKRLNDNKSGKMSGKRPANPSRRKRNSLRSTAIRKKTQEMSRGEGLWMSKSSQKTCRSIKENRKTTLSATILMLWVCKNGSKMNKARRLSKQTKYLQSKRLSSWTRMIKIENKTWKRWKFIRLKMIKSIRHLATIRHKAA